MSIVDIKPSDLTPELRIKVEHVSRLKKLSWKDTLIFLASEVVSPMRRNSPSRRDSSRPKVVSPSYAAAPAR